MTRMVLCKKLDQQSQGFDHAPYPGEIGRRIYDSISMEAWERWLRYQTILMNENGLSAIKPDHIELIESMMIEFLFDETV